MEDKKYSSVMGVCRHNMQNLTRQLQDRSETTTTVCALLQTYQIKRNQDIGNSGCNFYFCLVQCSTFDRQLLLAGLPQEKSHKPKTEKTAKKVKQH